MPDVTLTERELHMCGVNAALRTVRHLTSPGSTPRWGQSMARLNSDDEWLGCIGECATAKYLDRYWAGMNWGAVDASIADVRTVPEEGLRLILHKEDRDDLPVVLAVVSRKLLPVVRLVGFMIGREGKQAQFWTDPGTGRPAFFVPAAVPPLRPMEALLDHEPGAYAHMRAG